MSTEISSRYVQFREPSLVEENEGCCSCFPWRRNKQKPIETEKSPLIQQSKVDHPSPPPEQLPRQRTSTEASIPAITSSAGSSRNGSVSSCSPCSDREDRGAKAASNYWNTYASTTRSLQPNEDF